MTLGEFLTLTDANMRVTVRINVYETDFETTRLPKYFTEKLV